MRNVIIEALKGKRLEVDKGWVLNNDIETDEIMGSDYSYMVYKFFDDEVRYLPDGEEPHPVKFDKYEQLTSEDLELYYRELFGSTMIDILTISEAVELDCVSNHYKDTKTAIRALQKKLQRGSSFKHGVDCRKAGDTWLVTRGAIEREYQE